jgi:hypothetical protein
MTISRKCGTGTNEKPHSERLKDHNITYLDFKQKHGHDFLFGSREGNLDQKEQWGCGEPPHNAIEI